MDQAHRIDFQHHIIPPRYLAEERERILGPAARHLVSRLEKWTPQASLEAMDEGGIRTAVVSVPPPGIWFGDAPAARRLARECNDFAARMAADHKGRFAFLGAIPLPDVDGALSEIDYARRVLKCVGFALMSNYDSRWLGDTAFAPVFEALNRAGSLVYVHPTVSSRCADMIPGIVPPTVEFPFDTTRAILSLLVSGTLNRSDNIRFVFAHAGGALPMLAQRIASGMKARGDMQAAIPHGAMHEFRKLYFDVVNAADPIAFGAVRELAGVSQLLYGSDFPYWPPGHTGSQLAQLGLMPTDLLAIERENALALLPQLRDAG